MATVFSMKDPNPGVWFAFDSEDPDSGEVRVRALSAAIRSEIHKKTVKKRDIYKHGNRFEVTDTNEELFSEMLWDYSIVEWNRLEDDDGNEIKCTTENKLALMQNNPGFAKFISNCLEILNEEEENRVAIVEKNSSSGLSDSKKNRIAQSAKN